MEHQAVNRVNYSYCYPMYYSINNRYVYNMQKFRYVPFKINNSSNHRIIKLI